MLDRRHQSETVEGHEQVQEQGVTAWPGRVGRQGDPVADIPVRVVEPHHRRIAEHDHCPQQRRPRQNGCEQPVADQENSSPAQPSLVRRAASRPRSWSPVMRPYPARPSRAQPPGCPPAARRHRHLAHQASRQLRPGSSQHGLLHGIRQLTSYVACCGSGTRPSHPDNAGHVRDQRGAVTATPRARPPSPPRWADPGHHHVPLRRAVPACPCCGHGRRAPQPCTRAALRE